MIVDIDIKAYSISRNTLKCIFLSQFHFFSPEEQGAVQWLSDMHGYCLTLDRPDDGYCIFCTSSLNKDDSLPFQLGEKTIFTTKLYKLPLIIKDIKVSLLLLHPIMFFCLSKRSAIFYVFN